MYITTREVERLSHIHRKICEYLYKGLYCMYIIVKFEVKVDTYIYMNTFDAYLEQTHTKSLKTALLHHCLL